MLSFQRKGLFRILLWLGVSFYCFSANSENESASGNLSSAQPPKEKLVYLPFREAVIGLSPKEGNALSQLFKDYNILDLKKSQLPHLQQWIDDLNNRLTKAIEQLGNQYPNYKVYVISSEAPDAFVYKSQAPGTQTYRGHVFISSGMIQRMIDNLGTDLQSMTNEQLDLLMDGLSGIMAHEFSHPKQDELVKWEWRGAQDRGSDHGQGDELATDFMGMVTLRLAKLDPSAMLTGLELGFGESTSRGNLLNQAFRAVKSTHPKFDLRLNLSGVAATKMRVDMGNPPLVPISLDREKLKAELGRVVSNKDMESRFEAEAMNKPGSPFINVIDVLIKKMNEGKFTRKNNLEDEVVTLLGVLKRVEEKKPNLSEEEISKFKELVEYLLRPGRFNLGVVGSWDKLVDGGKSLSGDTVAVSYTHLRAHET